MTLVIALMALAVITCIAQNRWDQMTAEDKMGNALVYVIVAILVLAIGIIALIFI